MGIVIKNKVKVNRANTFNPIPVGTYSSPIKLKPELVFHNFPAYAVDSLGKKLAATNLCDISTINNVNGVPLGTPANQGMVLSAYNLIKSDWYNVGSYKVIFDLDGVYDLDYAYVWIEGSNRGPVRMACSEDGTTWKELFGPQDQLNSNGWRKIEFNIASKGGNKFFMLGCDWADMGIRSLVVYGRPVGTKLNHGVKLNRKVPSRKADESIGTNGFYFEHPEEMYKVSSIQRFYVEPDWFMGDAFRRTGDAIGKHPDDLTFKFSTSHMGSIDQLLQGFKNTGAKVMFTQVSQPVCYRPVGTSRAGQSKPVDPGFSSTVLAHTVNPLNYKFIARVGYNIAARYGSNKNVDQTYIQLQEGQQVKVGLNLIYCMEIGNEMDKWWLGEQAYANPEEMAAYMSALYDGHKGAMGPGYGIKAADPSMKVSMISLAAGDNTAYIRQMLWWFDKYRGEGDYAFDVINYHWYNSSQGSQDVGDSSYALQPERAQLMDVNQRWCTIRDTYCQSAELWLTETGYDEHLGGVYAPKFNTQFLRSRYKSYWLVRTHLVDIYGAVDVTNQYWYATTGGQKLQELNPNEPNPAKFISSAMAEGIQNTEDWNRQPLMSFWYMANIKSALEGYTYSHEVFVKGELKAEDRLINSTSEYLWALAFKNVVDGTGLLVIWLDSAEQRTESTTVKVIESTVQVVNIDNAEVRQSITGTITNVTPLDGLIGITISECPIIVKTTNLSVPLVIQPLNIEKQVLEDSSVLLTWLDRNIEETDAIISRSLTLNGVYDDIYQGKTYKAQYVDETALPNVNYFYKIKLIRAGGSVPIIVPSPPTIVANDQLDTIEATHQVYPNNIVVSINNNSYEKYNGHLSVGNVNRPEGYFKFKIEAGFNRTESSIVYSPAFTVSNDPVPELWKTNFDHAYLGNKVLNYSNVQAEDGEEVKTIIDQIGALNMNYNGVAVPNLTESKPRFYDNLNGYVFLPNETNVKYSTAYIQGGNYPSERWIIGVISNFQLYEAFVNNFFSPYIGDLGQEGLRTKNAADFPGDTSWKTNVPIALNRPFLIRQKFTDNASIPDRVSTDMWVNGVYVGQTMTTYKNTNMSLVIGADTNNSHWGFMFYGFNKGHINESIASVMTSQLMAKYNVNLPIELPYAGNLNVVKSGSTYTATFVYKGINNIPENISKRKVRWIIFISGPTIAYYMPELEGLLTFNANDYPQYDMANKRVRVEITCEDTAENKFSIPQSFLK